MYDSRDSQKKKEKKNSNRRRRARARTQRGMSRVLSPPTQNGRLLFARSLARAGERAPAQLFQFRASVICINSRALGRV